MQTVLQNTIERLEMVENLGKEKDTQIASLLNTVVIQNIKLKKLEDELENHDKRITKVETELILKKYKNYTKLGGYLFLYFKNTKLQPKLNLFLNKKTKWMVSIIGCQSRLECLATKLSVLNF